MAKDNVKVQGSDPLLKGSDEVEQKAQAEAKQGTPEQASQAISANTQRYVDGDGSGSKGFVTDPAQRVLLDVGDPESQQEQKELKPGEMLPDPEKAEDQVKKVGESIQRALKKQEEQQKQVEKEARKQSSEQQKAEDERPNPSTQLDDEEKRVRAGGKSNEELAKEQRENSDNKDTPFDKGAQVTFPATSRDLGGVDTTQDVKKSK